MYAHEREKDKTNKHRSNQNIATKVNFLIVKFPCVRVIFSKHTLILLHMATR